MLVESRANIGHVAKGAKTALLCAASLGHSYTCAFLVANRANLHHRDASGVCAVDLAKNAPEVSEAIKRGLMELKKKQAQATLQSHLAGPYPSTSAASSRGEGSGKNYKHSRENLNSMNGNGGRLDHSLRSESSRPHHHLEHDELDGHLSLKQLHLEKWTEEEVAEWVLAKGFSGK